MAENSVSTKPSSTVEVSRHFQMNGRIHPQPTCSLGRAKDSLSDPGTMLPQSNSILDTEARASERANVCAHVCVDMPAFPSPRFCELLWHGFCISSEAIKN